MRIVTYVFPIRYDYARLVVMEIDVPRVQQLLTLASGLQDTGLVRLSFNLDSALVTVAWLNEDAVNHLPGKCYKAMFTDAPMSPPASLQVADYLFSSYFPKDDVWMELTLGGVISIKGNRWHTGTVRIPAA